MNNAIIDKRYGEEVCLIKYTYNTLCLNKNVYYIFI